MEESRLFGVKKVGDNLRVFYLVSQKKLVSFFLLFFLSHAVGSRNSAISNPLFFV